MLDLTKFKVYMVGGYVRDRLLRRECKDHDFVVVGATPQIMFANGFQKVGADFPVYLSPHGDEYALARTERKTSAGYNGFETDFNPSITLEEDLERRDLTINAMAREVIGWNELGHAQLSDEIIDPFNGQRDLKKGVLRHVSKAFADDPVRVLRVARFSARYGFEIHKSTNKLMEQLVTDGELDHLVPERVWTEFEKAMGEDTPSRFFWALSNCGAYDVLMPELGKSIITTGYYLKQAANLELDVINRMMIIFSGIDNVEASSLLERLKAPSDVQRLSRKMRFVLELAEMKDVSAEVVLETLIAIDAFGNNKDYSTVMFTILTCHNAVNRSVISNILVAHKSARDVSFASLTDKQRDKLTGREIGEAINKLRLKKIQKVFQ